MDRVAFSENPDEKLTVIDYNPDVLKIWGDATCMKADLRQPPFPLSGSHFDEVHAYELLNLLPGDEGAFFAFWREIWRIMVPGGKVYASVPHWESQWIYAYPSPQRVYTPGLLTYLDQDHHVVAKEAFDTLWPRPYCFKVDSSSSMRVEGSNIGYRFIMVKA